MDDASPSPVANMDMRTYRTNIARALSNPEDPAISPPFVSWAKKGLDEKTDKQKKTEDFYNFIVRLAINDHLQKIDQLINQYSQMAAWHHEQARLAHETMQKSMDKIGTINDFLGGVNDILANKERSGVLDRPNAIKILKSRGIQIDDKISDEHLLAELKRQEKAAAAEQKKLSGEYDTAKTAGDYHDEMERENIQKAEELTRRRDAIRENMQDPAEEEKALKDLANEYSLDVHKKAAAIEARKNPDVDMDKQADTKFRQATVKNEEEDFLSSAADLTKEFTLAANKLPDPVSGPAPANPSLSI